MSENSGSLEELLCSLKNKPQAVIVKRLMEHGNVETLTHLKLKLVKQGRLCKDFPKGEPFSRRKPKGRSSLQTLEERLAVDICELTAFIDSGIVTHDLKNMFKPVSADEHNMTSNETDCEGGKGNAEMEKGCKTPILVASQGRLSDFGLRLSHEHCRESFAKLEATLHQVKETFNGDIALLKELVEKQGNLLKEQDKEISLLRTNNNSLKDEVEKLREANVFHQNANKLNTNTDNLSKRTSLETNSMETAAGKTRGHANDPGSSGTEMPKSADIEILKVNKESGVADIGEPSYSEVVKSPKPTKNPVKLPAKEHSSSVHVSKQNKHAINAEDNKHTVDKQNNRVLRNDEEQSQHNGDHDFIGVKRNRNKARRFFLSGIDEKVNAEIISRYLQQRGISFSFLKVFESKRKGTVSAKLHVSLADSTAILQDNFWPKYVRCRSWLSKGKMENAKELGKRADQVATTSTLV